MFFNVLNVSMPRSGERRIRIKDIVFQGSQVGEEVFGHNFTCVWIRVFVVVVM